MANISTKNCKNAAQRFREILIEILAAINPEMHTISLLRVVETLLQMKKGDFQWNLRNVSFLKLYESFVRAFLLKCLKTCL